MASDTSLEQPFPRPLSGAVVEQLPSARIPSRAPLRGRYVELVAQDAARHAQDLYAAGHESEDALKTWDYLAYGPWESVEDYTATMRAQSATFDTIFYAIRPLDSKRFEGQSSYLDINPQDASSASIEDGALVELGNDRGKVVLQARLSDAVARGVLYSPKGAWLRTSKTGQTVNALIDADMKTDIVDGACYNETFVDLRPVREA